MHVGINIVPYVSIPFTVRKIYRKNGKFYSADGKEIALVKSKPNWIYVAPLALALFSVAVLLFHLTPKNTLLFLFASLFGSLYGEAFFFPDFYESKFFLPVMILGPILAFLFFLPLTGSSLGYFFYGWICFYCLDVIYHLQNDESYEVVKDGQKQEGYVLIRIREEE